MLGLVTSTIGIFRAYTPTPNPSPQGGGGAAAPESPLRGRVWGGGIAALTATILQGSLVPALADSETIAKAAKNFVIPAYELFAQSAGDMRKSMNSLCASQSPETLTTAQASFISLVNAWSEAEIIRFGPITSDNRLEKVLFWPDRKSIGLKQIQAALAERDATAADPAQLTKKSVAMQGLGALEFVLFGTGFDELKGPGDPYRCAYGLAVASNLDTIATEVLDGWRMPDGMAVQWSNPGPDNPAYRTDDEAMTELFNVFVHGLEMTRDVRLKGFLGATPAEDKPKQAIYWRSGATVISVSANMHGMRKLFEASGLADKLPADSSWIADSIAFEFNTINTMFDKAAGPIVEVLKDRRRDSLPAALLITSHLSDLFGVNLAGALGLSAGFSSLDGD
jgi:predicted lipoprotein